MRWHLTPLVGSEEGVGSGFCPCNPLHQFPVGVISSNVPSLPE